MLNGQITFSGSVTTTSKLNLRQNSPDSKAPVIRKLPPGLPMAVTAIVGGENVQGNALWYQVKDGFVWSGGCSAVDTAAAAPVNGSASNALPVAFVAATFTSGAIPAGAKGLLDLIAEKEAPAGYGTLFGNNQIKLTKPLIQMTIAEVIAAGPDWAARFRSSACGRYQFVNATLKGLRVSENLSGTELFDPGLQDRLGYALLDRRGYESFMAGTMSREAFGLGLAQEWASFPVLADCQGAHRPVQRGETFYAGDALNKALITPEKVEAALDAVRQAQV
jgi:muramidase (phage lysozyme)